MRRTAYLVAVLAVILAACSAPTATERPTLDPWPSAQLPCRERPGTSGYPECVFGTKTLAPCVAPEPGDPVPDCMRTDR